MDVAALRTWIVAPALALIAALAPSLALAVELLPHRAAYRMTLDHAGRGSGIIAADGAMAYRFARVCDGWTVENRTRLRMTFDGGQVSETLWTFVSWESTDGRSFRFRATLEEGGRTLERIRGHATLDSDGAGTAVYEEPEPAEVALAAGTLFPTRHMVAVIRAAERGEGQLHRQVFDGSSEDNPYLVNAHFGPLPDDDRAAIAAATGLAELPAWWARFAFFPERSAETTPEFELGARFRADGVADRITQHFADFAITVHLQRLETLPEPDC